MFAPSTQDLDESSEEFTDTAIVVASLRQLANEIERGEHAKIRVQDIYDSIEEYLPGGCAKEPEIGLEVLNYLYLGWWVSRGRNPQI